MTRRANARGSRWALLGLAALLALVATPSSARADLVVIQESNGFPGAQDTETARQRVFVAKDKLRVLDDRHGWALLVRLDDKVVREAYARDNRGGQYVERPLSFYQTIREKREATRAQKVKEYGVARDRAKNDTERAELKKALGRMGLREDGKTEARLEHFPGDAKSIAVVVNGKEQQVKVEHYIVRENEGDPVFDVWVAPELGRPESVFSFYREIGTFSDVVVKKVLELNGFPLEIKATLDDGNNKKTLHTKVFEVRDELVDPVAYDVPKGWEKTEGKDPSLDQKREKCAVCGKEFIPGQGEGRYWTDPFERKTYPVCSDEHRRELLRLKAEKK